MNGRAIPFLSLLILASALSSLAAQEGNPAERRRELPYRLSPHALGGHDRADLRRDWNLFWFGGLVGPDYLDYKNRLAAQEAGTWTPRRLQGSGSALPSAQSLTDSPLPATQSTGPAGVGGTWTNLGPFSQLTSTTPDIDSGRPVAIVPHPTAATLYLATSGGGVFRCDNANPAASGDWTWYSVTDALPTSSSGGNVSVGALAMSPADPNTLYLGAGDAFDAEGRGFFKTTDGGTTWTAAPTASLGSATRSYAILPLDASRVLWGTNSGLRISTDGGTTFATAAGGPATGQVWSLQKVTSTDLLCSVEVTPSGATNGTGTIYYSTNAGTSWTLATLPSTATLGFTPGRITIQAAGDGATAYAILEDTTTSPSSTTVARGVLKSTDKGVTWTWQAAPTASGGLFQGTGPQMGTDGGQGWYNHGLAVDPNNPSRLFVGANLALYRSIDGGLNWVQLTHWYGSGHVYAHADFHAAAWSPTGTTLYVANDGGLAVMLQPFIATIPTASFDLTFLDNRRNKGLASHLAYNVGSTAAASPSDSRWRISLGLQDDGTRLRQPNTPGTALTGTEGTFEDMIGGDGFATLFHPSNGDQVLGSIYYTDIYRSTNGGASFSESITGITEANNKDLAPFAPKVVPGDAAHPAVVYTSTNGKIYQSVNFGASWSALGTSGLPTPLDTSSTATITPTPLFIRNLAASSLSASILGIAGNQSRVFLTSNGGSNWSQAGALPGVASYLSCIEFDPAAPSTIYVGSVAPSATANHLWKSINGGASWVAIDGSSTTSNGLPFGIPVHVVKADPVTAQKVYAGTDFGVYVSSNGGSTWSRFGSNLPLVAVRDLYLAPDGSFLRAATFGRGVWELRTAGLLDLNADGVKDVRDLLFFAKYYGTTNATCDLNGDGTVNDADLTLLLAGL
ncbi:dockerin type I domain-containing protein [Geothrix oryzisoli]|uniref:dockerin type I domain-containing protein n=1 Tax=Geothrix oryzisoli TaxID=2922721 RepID=UPI001FADF607|nr:dockerin type I domain-containing protein [Geothrix oryzisoli]